MNGVERDVLRCRLHARCEAIAQSWQRALAPTGLAEVSPAEVHRELVRMTGEAVTLLLAAQFAPARARALGASVVRLRCFAPDALRGTLQVLGQQLVADFTAAQLADVQPRLTLLLSEVAAGFTVAVRETILAEQHALRAAQLVEQGQVEARLRSSMEAAIQAARQVLIAGMSPTCTPPPARPRTEPAGPCTQLTPREREILALVATGRRNAAIAAQLGITERTVEYHITHLLDKLGADSRTAAVHRANQLGLRLPAPPAPPAETDN